MTELRTAPPAYATRRDPDAPTNGARVAVIAEALGTPLMPWQRYVADVAGERNPRDPERYRYPIVVITVPRQSGKTTLLRAIAVERAVMKSHQNIFATAQTGKDAGARWKDMVARVEESPLRRHIKVFKGAGAMSLDLPNGSHIRAFAPTPKSIHGETPPLVMIDEAWAFDDAAGEDLMAAIRPAQITLRDRQLIIVSTAGTAASTFLKGWVDAGRLATQDPHATIGYFEWSLPDDADPYDPASWDFHPAIGHTISRDDIAAEAGDMTRGNFLRSYMNVWTTSTETVIDLDAFEALHAPAQVPPARVHLAYDVAADRSGASVWAGWRDDAGTHVRQIRSEAGVGWLAPFIMKARVELKPASIGADDGGPARMVNDTLAAEGIELTLLSARDYGTACTSVREHVKSGTLDYAGVDGDACPEIRQAILNAATKFLGDQVVWDRRRSAGPIDELVAMTVALRLAEHGPVPLGPPVMHFG